MEKLSVQQEQTLGTLDTNIDAMIEKRTQAIMDRLDGLLGSRSGPKDGEPNSGAPSREPRVNFNDQQNRRRTYGFTRGRGSSAGCATGDNRTWGPNIREDQLTIDRPQINDRSKAQMRLGEVIPETGVMRAKEGTIQLNRTEGKFQVHNPYQGAMILRQGIEEMLHQWPRTLNLWTGLWRHSLRVYLEPMNVAKDFSETKMLKRRIWWLYWYLDRSNETAFLGRGLVRKARMQCAYQ